MIQKLIDIYNQGLTFQNEKILLEAQENFNRIKIPKQDILQHTFYFSQKDFFLFELSYRHEEWVRFFYYPDWVNLQLRLWFQSHQSVLLDAPVLIYMMLFPEKAQAFSSYSSELDIVFQVFSRIRCEQDFNLNHHQFLFANTG